MIIEIKELKEIIRHIVNEQINSFAQRQYDISSDEENKQRFPSDRRSGIKHSSKDDYNEINQYYSFLFRSNSKNPMDKKYGLRINKVISFLRRVFAGSDRSSDAEVLVDKDKKNIYVSVKILVETEKEVNDIIYMLAADMLHNFDLSLINVAVSGEKESELGLIQALPEYPIV